MKFPVGTVGMSHCGSESRGGIFPSLQKGFTFRSALGSGVCHSCPCYWENKGIFRRCKTLDESHLGVRSEGLAMTLPIHPVTHASIFLQNYVLFLYQCPLASAVFFLCLVYTASFCLQPARSPLGAEIDSGCYNCIRARRFAVTSSFNKGVFNCILDTRLDRRTTYMWKC